jgi:hypothetical protein
MECLDAMGSDLGPLYDLLKYECHTLHVDWAEFEVLFGASPERIDLLNEAAAEFFGRLQDAHFERVLLLVARLVDPPSSAGKSNATLCRLPQVVDPQIRPKIEILLNIAKNECAFAQDWRNRHIAHRDLDLALNRSAMPLDPASRLNVKRALSAIVEVLNAVELHYCSDCTVGYEITHSPLGAIALLDVLEAGVDARKAEMERMMSGKFSPSDFAPKLAI